ncbi:response regulator transcription factor [uncultured Paraglaciecola sp.]|uniref:response regulator n=1 Tax=uncultured Paraglaciecola sp. TaxID=1765024 RepID=UPI0025976F6B|nr:response regulator transcription factor [uncultured Paraglaciecola sp.]
MYTLLIADDHPLYRDALKGALNGSLQSLSLLEAGSLADTLKIIESTEVDLLLLDLHMPGSQDLFGLIHVRKLFPDLPVMIISGSENKDIVSKVLNTGAMGFIPKTTSSEDIAKAVETVLQGDIWVPDTLVNELDSQDDAFTELAAKIATLTPAQYKVLCLMRDGLLNKQIAYELGIAVATVKAHVTEVFKKLSINNRTQGVLIASQLQLEPPSPANCHH